MSKHLTGIQNDLASVQRDIDEITNELRKFKGIGENICIDKLNSFKDDCRVAIREIDNALKIREEIRKRKEQERLLELERERKLQELLQQGKTSYS